MMDLFNIKANKAKEEAENKKLNDSLQFLEQVLREEDPEFVASINSLNVLPPQSNNIDKIHVDFVLDEAIKMNQQQISREETIKKLNFLIVMFEFKKNPKKVLLFWMASLCLIGGGFYSVKLALKPHQNKLFIHSIGDLHVPIYTFNTINQSEMFFDNPLFTKNVMVIPKLIVNLVPSETSTDLPMLSFEILIEGLSNDPIIEIKDREAEFRDAVLRVAEDFTYDDLQTIEGKENLSEMILNKVNSVLSQNQVRKIYFNQFILKR